ncbi:MAG: RecT family protein [Betaproteobacteria bacterium ADurb.Bin341]|nr:MAG: RecT family protein [Betaproteobacteria bacterium ADurb.Bin341]
MSNNNLAVVQQAETGAMMAQPDFGSQGLLADFEKVRAMQELANIMATAKVTVPQHLAGKAGDCLAVVMQAAQWKMNPFAVAQKTHVVNGTLGYEAQLVNAVVQSSGAIVGHFHYEYQGEGANVACRVGAVIRGDKDITWGEWLSAATVTTKNSPLWKTNPKQQLGYLQVKNWARLHTPGAILGVYSDDELEALPPRDMGNAEVVTEAPTSNTRTNALKEHLGAGKKKQQPAITVEQVIDGINAANTPEELLAAAEQAKNLNADDKAKAGSAYTARLHQLKAAANTIDQGTGEIYEPGEVPAIDPDDEFLKEGWPGTVRNPRKSDVTL